MKLDWKKYSIGEINEMQVFYFDGTQEVIPLQILQSINYQDFMYDALTGHTTIFGISIMDSKRIGFLKGYVCLYLNQLYLCYLHDFEMNAKEINMNKETENVIVEQELHKLEQLSEKEQELFRYNDNTILTIGIAIVSLSVLWTGLLIYIACKVFMYLV